MNKIEKKMREVINTFRRQGEISPETMERIRKNNAAVNQIGRAIQSEKAERIRRG